MTGSEKEQKQHARRSFLARSLRGLALGASGGAGVMAALGQANASTSTSVLFPATTNTNQFANRFLKTAEPDFERYVGEPHELRRLNLFNPRTGEQGRIVFWYKGRYVLHGLHQIDLLLRDTRANELLRIDVDVLNYLHRVQSELGTDERIQILSGYRSQQTNDMLRKRFRNVAKYSLHIEGKAIDFRIPGLEASDIERVARDLKLGGTGYYPDSGFVHIDSGAVRSWIKHS